MLITSSSCSSKISASSTVMNTRTQRQTKIVGWTVSVVVHIAIILVLISFTGVYKQPGRPAKATPKATIERNPDKLKNETVIKNLRITPLDTNNANTPKLLSINNISQTDSTSPDISDAIGVWAEGTGSGETGDSFSLPAPTGGGSELFSGSGGQAHRVCYVVDCSGSMVIAFDYVRAELKKAIRSLKPNQYFQIIFYSSGQPLKLSNNKMLRAGMTNRKQAVGFIDKIKLSAVKSTNAACQAVVTALIQAFNSKTPRNKPPEVIFFLTDGQYNHQKVIQELKILQQKRQVPAIINVIACGSTENKDFLEGLARAYSGRYNFVSDEKLAGYALKHRTSSK